MRRLVVRVTSSFAAIATLFAGSFLVAVPPAWAADPTHPVLRLSDANVDKPFGTCGVSQQTGNTVYVFAWPGGTQAVGDIQALELDYTFDDGLGGGPKTRPMHLTDGMLGEENGTPIFTIEVLGGLSLGGGTSTISGQVANAGTDGFPDGFFSVAHRCLGTHICPIPPRGCEEDSAPPVTTTTTTVTTTTAPATSNPAAVLPVTGKPIAGFALAGVATTLVGGVLLLLARRRREQSDS
jgi:LPXTG-motif cell wall-anchored protein